MLRMTQASSQMWSRCCLSCWGLVSHLLCWTAKLSPLTEAPSRSDLSRCALIASKRLCSGICPVQTCWLCKVRILQCCLTTTSFKSNKSLSDIQKDMHPKSALPPSQMPFVRFDCVGRQKSYHTLILGRHACNTCIVSLRAWHLLEPIDPASKHLHTSSPIFFAKTITDSCTFHAICKLMRAFH